MDRNNTDNTAADNTTKQQFTSQSRAAGWTRKQTAKQVVASNPAALKAMNVAELTQFGKDAGFDSHAGFAAWKRALADAGIDYNSMRDARRAAKQSQREAAVTHTLTLFSDAKARTDRFAICDAGGEPVWYGKFFDGDRDYNGEQSSAEMAAAKKAVWLASKVAESVGDVIKLTLKVDAEWLTWANCNDPKRGGKAKDLRHAAERLGVVLEVEHIPGTGNPADKWTVARGYQRWQDYHRGLTGLVDGASREE